MIFVCLHKIDERIDSGELIGKNKLIISNKTLEIVGGYYHEIDRYRKVAGEIIVRKKLGQLLNVGVIKENFLYTRYQRPYVKLDECERIDFNISHSGEWVVAAISFKTPVGIDVEEITGIGLEVFNRILTTKEYEKYIIDENKRFNLFKIWTAKESFLKMAGTGLYQAPDSFSLSYEEGYYYQPEYENFIIKSYKPDERHVISLCGKKNCFHTTFHYIDYSYLCD